MQNPQNYEFIAHNVEFDYLIWTHPWARQVAGYWSGIDFKRPPLSNIVCTKGMTQRFGAGASLDDAAMMLKLPVQKDKVGKRIMMKQCKPDKTGNFPVLTEQEWQQFTYYGTLDTVLLRQVYRAIPQLEPNERWAWEWTFRENLTGLRIDLPLLEGMETILRADLSTLNHEFNQLVGKQFALTQRQKYLDWLRQYMPNFPDLRKETVEEYLASPPAHVPPEVTRTVEIKSIAGSTSVKKVATCRMRLVGDRVYGNLNYNGAFTKRWAGQGLQVHNFPRAEQINIEQSVHSVKNNAAAIPTLYPSGHGTKLVKNLLRRIFIADQALAFYCGDYSKIEPTVLFWLIGLGPIPKKVYEEMAGDIFNKPMESIEKEGEERQLGKNSFLGSGYGMGHKKFQSQVKTQSGLVISLELSKLAINTYRKKYPEVVQLWYQLASAFTNATYGQTTSLCNGKIIVAPMTGRFSGVYIQIPSGSKLYYHSAGASEGKLIYKQSQSGKEHDKHIYGGLLTEHVCSATARDIMLNGMMSIEQAGFSIKNTVHDEVWAMGTPGRQADFDRAMLTMPQWAEGIHLTVDSGEGERYLK
jgi:DNA polymerase